MTMTPGKEKEERNKVIMSKKKKGKSHASPCREKTKEPKVRKETAFYLLKRQRHGSRI